MWAMIDNMFSSKFMFFNSSCSCASDVRRPRPFPGRGREREKKKKRDSTTLSSDVGPRALKTGRLLLDSSSRGENASLTLTLSYDSDGGSGETSSPPESALRSTRITANASLWAARCHSPSVEKRRTRRNARQLRKTSAQELNGILVFFFPQIKTEGVLRVRRQPPVEARVRIMPSLHLNNG